MMSQGVERTRIRTGHYGQFRGEWVNASNTDILLIIGFLTIHCIFFSSVEATAPSAEHLDGLLDEEEPEIKRSSSVGASSKKLPGGGMGFGNLISADILAEKRLKKVHHDDKKEKKEKSSVLHAEPSKSPSTVKTKAPATVRKHRSKASSCPSSLVFGLS